MSTGTITLRPLGADDAPALLAFYNGLSPETIHTFRPLRAQTTLPVCQALVQENLARPRQRFDLAAWVGEQMIGWAFLDKVGSARPQLGLGVADAYQGQGIGSALLDELLSWGHAQGLAQIELMVVKENDHARHLYHSRGFTVDQEAFDEVDQLTYCYMSSDLRAALPLRIQRWTPAHLRWAQVQRVIAQLGQTKWVESAFPWHQHNELLVATSGGLLVGFLRLVTQVIGADEELPLTELDGQPLLEAKIMAFGVIEHYRRQGIGWALQQAAVQRARDLGCYQLRSHSSGSNQANHRLKLRLGFAIQRVVRGDDRQGAYFIMPLRTAAMNDVQTKEST